MYVSRVQLVKFFTVREELRTPLPLVPAHAGHSVWTGFAFTVTVTVSLRLLDVSGAEFSSELPPSPAFCCCVHCHGADGLFLVPGMKGCILEDPIERRMMATAALRMTCSILRSWMSY